MNRFINKLYFLGLRVHVCHFICFFLKFDLSVYFFIGLFYKFDPVEDLGVVSRNVTYTVLVNGNLEGLAYTKVSDLFSGDMSGS